MKLRIRCLHFSKFEKVTIHKISDDNLQSHFYHGGLMVIMFTPYGHIFVPYLNSPGTTHESTMAIMSRMYNLIDDIFYSMEVTAKVVVDSAFATEDCPSLVKSYQ
jgi:hypothetical protein